MEQNFLHAFDNLEIDGEKITKPSPIPWYPNSLAWSTNLGRSQLRRHATLGQMHKFLIAETESGYLTRQEAVSMLPPLFLDIKESSSILDLCAAPGSKTAQMIELMHVDAEKTTTDGIPSGVCIANDKNNQRCYMLVHQAKRLNSPCCIITNHDASMFPGVVTRNSENELIPLKFDRVLCDVPCTGDGTMRKNLDIWKNYKPNYSAHVHGVQIKILKRGLELLSVGGRLVYSTCSMSPIEDEAVIGWVLEQCKGAVELIDCSDLLPDLKRRPGVSNWKVHAPDGSWLASHSEVGEQTHLAKSMFPTENNEHLHLERSMRLVPHDQDTGGFFVAALRKVKSLPWETDGCAAVQKQNKLDNEEDTPLTRQKDIERHRGVYKEDPFYFYKDAETNPTAQKLVEFFGFEGLPTDRILSRSDPEDDTRKARQLYIG